MGTTNTKEVVRYVESDESKKAAMMAKLDNQLEQLKLEVTGVEPSIKENVVETVQLQQDALLMRYSQLQDKQMIAKNIQDVFGGFPLLGFLVETATKMVSAMTSTEELTEILRWQERKMVKRVGSKVYGIEAHYKVKILEETKSSMFRSSKDTVVLIAYKCIAHAMDLDPATIPDDEEHKKLTF